MTTQLRNLFGACLIVIVEASLLTAASYDDGHGKLWRQPAETLGYTWNHIETLCPTDGATECGGSLQGWTWATQQQTIDLFNRFLPPTHQLSVETPGIEGYVSTPFGYTTTFAMNGAPYSFFNAIRGWTSTRTGDGLGLRGTISDGGGPVSFYASLGVNDPFSVSQAPGYLNETGIWLWKNSVLTAGDFDSDADVDGRDFMFWQRDAIVGALNDWQENYGNSPQAVSSTVPEPAGIGLLAAATFQLSLFRTSRLRRVEVSARKH